MTHVKDYFGPDVATLGDRIAAARAAASMTQAQLARRHGVKSSTIANWEEDRSEPRANRLAMLAGVLNVSVGWLLSGAGDGVEPALDIEDPKSAHLADLLADFRDARVEQAKVAQRMARIEKTLRQLVGRQAA